MKNIIFGIVVLFASACSGLSAERLDRLEAETAELRDELASAQEAVDLLLSAVEPASEEEVADLCALDAIFEDVKSTPDSDTAFVVTCRPAARVYYESSCGDPLDLTPVDDSTWLGVFPADACMTGWLVILYEDGEMVRQ
jgi:hypothetical protein